MILYMTKQTIERYKIELPEEMEPAQKYLAKALMKKERDDKLFEWGGKLFYFDRRKCIQFVNFASKFTLFMVDVKKDMVYQAANMMAHYLLSIYADDQAMTDALKRMLTDHPLSCFAKLTDKSAISTLNYTQRTYLEDGDRLWDYIDSSDTLQVMDINRDVNFKNLFTMTINGKKNYIYAGERYRELVLARYGKNNAKPNLQLLK